MIGGGPEGLLVIIGILHSSFLVCQFEVLLGGFDFRANRFFIVVQRNVCTRFRVAEQLPTHFLAHQMYVMRKTVADGGDPGFHPYVDVDFESFQRRFDDFKAWPIVQTFQFDLLNITMRGAMRSQQFTERLANPTENELNIDPLVTYLL